MMSHFRPRSIPECIRFLLRNNQPKITQWVLRLLLCMLNQALNTLPISRWLILCLCRHHLVWKVPPKFLPLLSVGKCLMCPRLLFDLDPLFLKLEGQRQELAVPLLCLRFFRLS